MSRGGSLKVILKLVDRKDKPSQKVSKEQMLQMKITGGGGEGHQLVPFLPSFDDGGYWLPWR